MGYKDSKAYAAMLGVWDGVWFASKAVSGCVSRQIPLRVARRRGLKGKDMPSGNVYNRRQFEKWFEATRWKRLDMSPEQQNVYGDAFVLTGIPTYSIGFIPIMYVKEIANLVSFPLEVAAHIEGTLEKCVRDRFRK